MNIESLLWQDGWVPTTDNEVSQMLKLLSDKSKEANRVINSAQTEIQQLQKIGEAEQEKITKLSSKITFLLERYVMEEVDEDDRKETETTYKYKLARGEIVVSKPAKVITKPDAKVIAILMKVKDYKSFVAPSDPVFKWADFKKELELDEDGTVTHKPTGNIVAVPVVETPQTTKVNLSI